MVAKQKFYKKKLQEQRMKILKAIIEEEIERFVSEQDDGGDGGYDSSYDSGAAGGGGMHYSSGWGFGGGYGGGGGGGGDGRGGVLYPWMRGSAASALTGDIVPKITTVLGKGITQLGTQAISGVKKAVLGTISALLPFNDPIATKKLLDGITNWEQAQIRALDQHFSNGMAMIEEDWGHFKDDFWGIGFVASPANAIAAAITAEKGLDAALSVGNVLSGGRLQAAIEDLTPGGGRSVNETATEEQPKPAPKGDVGKAFSEAMAGKLKASPQSFGEAIKKFEAAGGSEETLKQLATKASKNPEIIEAGKKMMAPEMEAALAAIIKDVSAAISKGEIKVNAQEVDSMKKNLEGYLSKIVIESAKKKGIQISEEDLKTNPAFKAGVQKASQEAAKIQPPSPAQPVQTMRQTGPRTRTSAPQQPATQPVTAPAPTNKQ
jgi:hypothetical protein